MGNSDQACHFVASLMTRVKHNVSCYYIDGDTPAEREENFRWLFLPKSDPNGPDNPWDDPGHDDRYDQCYVVAEALQQTLAEQYAFDPQCLYVLIDPSGMRCENAVYVAYLYTPDPLDFREAKLLYAAAVPAGLQFATENALATYLAGQYAQLARGYERAGAAIVATHA